MISADHAGLGPLVSAKACHMAKRKVGCSTRRLVLKPVRPEGGEREGERGREVLSRVVVVVVVGGWTGGCIHTYSPSTGEGTIKE
jgi:hypothetical protein